MKKNNPLVCFLAFALAVSSVSCSAAPAGNSIDAATEKKIDGIIGKMTIQ